MIERLSITGQQISEFFINADGGGKFTRPDMAKRQIETGFNVIGIDGMGFQCHFQGIIYPVQVMQDADHSIISI